MRPCRQAFASGEVNRIGVSGRINEYFRLDFSGSAFVGYLNRAQPAGVRFFRTDDFRVEPEVDSVFREHLIQRQHKGCRREIGLEPVSLAAFAPFRRNFRRTVLV